MCDVVEGVCIVLLKLIDPTETWSYQFQVSIWVLFDTRHIPNISASAPNSFAQDSGVECECIYVLL